MRKFFPVALMSLSLGSCVSEQLDYNTIDLASSSDALLTKQVIYNLGVFLDSDIAIPAQVVVAAGTASTTNTVSPSVNFPLTNGLSILAGARTVTTAASGASIGGTNAAAQNWGFSAITDPYEFRRLQALYRFAIDQDDARLIRSYPLTYRGVAHTDTLCVHDEISRRCALIEKSQKGPEPKSVRVGGKKFFVRKPDGSLAERPPGFIGIWPPTGYTQTSKYKANALGDDNNKASGGSESYSVQVPDEFFLHKPNCVLCLRPHRHLVQASQDLIVNPLLKGNWLRWRSLSGATRPDNFRENDIPLGRSGHYDLYADHQMADHYTEFVVQILAASTQSAFSGSAGAPSATSGASAGGAKLNTQTAPVSLTLPSAGPLLTLPIE